VRVWRQENAVEEVFFITEGIASVTRPSIIKRIQPAISVWKPC
jgi:mannose-6-phosphate isomerase-like protein (cupin superfamily)